MAEDIWTEKPSTFTGFSSYRPVRPAYDQEKMDAWLEKLKKYYEMKDYMDEKIMLSTMIDVDNKLEAVKVHLESYPDERDDEKYCLERHYPSTAGTRVFNSVLFLTHLETWHKQLKEILEAKG